MRARLGELSTREPASSNEATPFEVREPSPDLLTIKDLTITVPSRSGRVVAVRNASFALGRGEAVGLVGESGSGKTLTCRAILGVLPPGCVVSDGRILFEGTDLAALDRREWERFHGSEIGAVFQDPASYLHPSLPVGRQLAEVLRTRKGLSRSEAKRQAIELFDQIGLRHPSFVYHQLPLELSGGMLQRVMIAIAISCDPQIVIADEATTALDVVTQAEVLALLKELRERLQISILFVSHDLAVVAELCDRIIVFYAGEVVEVGGREELTRRPLHPYTEALLRVSSVRSRSGSLEIIPGQPPAVGAQVCGCRFAGRCGFEVPACTAGPIPLQEVAPGRWSRCVRAEELVLIGESDTHA